MGGDNLKRKEESLAMDSADGGGAGGTGSGGVQGGTSGGATGGTSGGKQSRPKRARTKAEKKETPENTSRFHCNYCGRDLSTAIRARCAECLDYDSCLDCFSVGASLEPHKPTHAYRLIEVVQKPIFQLGWSADEEDKLLEGLEMYGVGNWEQVARMVGSKGAYDTEQHFLKVFLQSNCAPLPDPAKVLPAEDPPSADLCEDIDPKALRVMHKHQQNDAAGWMPKRQDFVYEWDNEAEDILGDMEISEEDSKADRDLKLQVLEIYNTKLDERKRRKDFVVERGLTDFKTYQAADKKRPKEEKDICDKLAPFARFLTPGDMDRCVQGILDERHLRLQLDVYREGYALGATTVSDCGRLVPQSKSKTRNAALSSEGLGSGAMSANPSTSASLSRRSRRPNGEAVIEDSSSTKPDVHDLITGILGPEIDISLTPGAELLSRTEHNLCKSLKISAHQYLIVKEVMVRESARLGFLRKKEAKALVRLDSTKVFKIHDYLQACGWIRSGTSGGAGSTSVNAARAAVSSNATPNGTRA